MASKSKINGKHAYMRKIHGELTRKSASLQTKLEGLQAEEKFLRSEVLLYQANIFEKEEMDTAISSNSGLLLKEQQINQMKQHLEWTKRASCFDISNSGQDLEKVESIREELIEKNKSPQNKQSLMKSLQLQGNINNYSFKINGLMKQSMKTPNGYMMDDPQLEVNPLPDIVKRMLKTSPDASHISRLLDNVHYLQMLNDERKTKAMELEEDIPDLQVENYDSNPLVIQFDPTPELTVTLNWHIVYDPKNIRFRNDIIIDCSDNVLAYFSQNEEVYPYLSTQEKLKNSEDVVNFFEAFM